MKRVKIQVEGRSLTKTAFRKEALAAGMTEDHINRCIQEGKFIPINMQIKVCPQCQVIRKTLCCACGCGHCYTCNYRWWCLPPYRYDNTVKTVIFNKDGSDFVGTLV